MPTSYPGALDALTNPAAGDALTSPSHSAQHTNINDAMEAVQAELGINPSGAFATVLARLTTAEQGVSLGGGTTIATTATTFVDVTSATVTMTTGARRCLVTVVAVGYNTNSSTDVYLDLAVDGTRIGGTDGLTGFTQITGGADIHDLCFSTITDPLTAASHTFKLQFRVTGGTGHIYNSPAKPLRFVVKELL